MKDCGQTWFKDGKYGLFIHFGLFSILAGEYRGRSVDGLAEWIMNNADIPLEEYSALAPQFDPYNFDAEAVCVDAKRWGMRYLCVTGKHHDGYALFDSPSDPFNSVQNSACGRDFVAELAAACARHGLIFCVYYSQAQDWHHPDGYRAYHDNSGKNFRRYLDEKCIPQLRELLTQYGPVGMIWFDTPMGMSREESAELVDLVKMLQPDCLVSGRIGNGLGDYMSTQDNRIPAFPVSGDWEVPATLNHSWGFKKNDHNWRSPSEILRRLLQIVARGGNYLLNIGPDASGHVPEASGEILGEIGRWLERCGCSLYGSRALEPYVYETPELCFTHRPHHLYIHVLNPQSLLGQEIPLPNITNKVVKARWLNGEGEGPLRVAKTLEGDPYWGILMPQACRETLALTLELETEEEAFCQLPL